MNPFQRLLNSRHGPPLLLLYAASFWGVVWYPLRLLDDSGLGGAWQLLTCYFAAVLLLLLVIRPPIAGFGRHPVRLLLLAIAAGWTNLGFVLAMLDGTVARALLLFYLSPVWTVLLGRLLLGESISRTTLLVLPLALTGVALMLWKPGLEWGGAPGMADLQAITAGFAFAVSNVLTRGLGNLGTRQKTMISWVGVVLVSAVGVLIVSPEVPDVAASIWGGAVLLGLAGFFPVTLAVVYGVSRMPVQRSAVILLFEILIGGLTAWLIDGETMRIQEWAGGAMILLAGFVTAVYARGEDAA